MTFVVFVYMYRLGEHMHKQPDRNHFTPIITAAVYYKDHKDSAVNVITEILSHLYTQSRHAAKCIAAIKYTYRGLPVIEYDIKSKEGAIVRVSRLYIHTYYVHKVLNTYKCF